MSKNNKKDSISGGQIWSNSDNQLYQVVWNTSKGVKVCYIQKDGKHVYKIVSEEEVLSGDVSFN